MESSTKQFRKRGAILTCLRSTDLHPSAEMLHEMLQPQHPDISLATVYRNLALFKNQGIIQSLGTVGGIERFDGNTELHAHFMCNSCGAIIDTPIAAPEMINSATPEGVQLAKTQLLYFGTCKECLETNN